MFSLTSRPSHPSVPTRQPAALLRLLLGACVLTVFLFSVSATLAQTPQPTPKRHIVFLLDLSQSMTSKIDPVTRQARRTGLQEELTGAQERATQILESVAGASDIEVSFWTFGERDRFVRVGPVMTTADAQRQLVGFFSADTARFSHNWTYIAHSLFRVTGQVLGLSDWTPDRDIPDNAGSVFAFVLTDGAEDFGREFDNRPFVDWQQRQQGRTQLVWRKWTMYGDRDDWPDPVTSARVSYAVLQMRPTIAPLNLSRLPADNVTNLERIPSEIVLVPQVLDQASQQTIHINGDYRTTVGPAAPCESAGQPGNVGSRVLSVQGRVDWRPAGPHQDTPPWVLQAPARSSTQERLVIPITGKPGAAIPADKVLEVGQRFPVRLNRDALCAELSRAYPGSTFILPRDEDDAVQLPAAGFVEVFDRPVYRFMLSTLEGTAPTAAFEPLTSDRWHVYNRVVRRYRMTSEAPIEAEVDYVATILKDGEPLSDASPLATFQLDGQTAPVTSGLSVTAPIASSVSLLLPAVPQGWLNSTMGRGFEWPSGEYTVHVCAAPRLRNVQTGSYEIEAVCEGCSEPSTTVENGQICTDALIHVGEPPVSWWFIGSVGGAVLAGLWIWLRWATRPRFRPRLEIGILSDKGDVRSAQESGPGGAWAAFMRRPGYIELQSGGRTVYMRKFLIDVKSNRNIVLGVAPNPATPAADFLLWCAAVPAHAADTRVLCDGRSLVVAGSTPDKFGAQVMHVSYSNLPVTISVHGADGSAAGDYRIQIRDGRR